MYQKILICKIHNFMINNLKTHNCEYVCAIKLKYIKKLIFFKEMK